MAFIQRELERISTALREDQQPSQKASLYAAQQALSWVLDPVLFKCPYDTISADTQANSTDYSAHTHQVQS